MGFENIGAWAISREQWQDTSCTVSNVVFASVQLSGELINDLIMQRQKKINHPLKKSESSTLRNAEIIRAEELADQAVLLGLSTDFAGVRNRQDLQRVISEKLRSLFNTFGFVISYINRGQKTHAAFLIDHEEKGYEYPGFVEAKTKQYPLDDGYFNQVIYAAGPVSIDISDPERLDNAPEYIRFWRLIGLKQIVGVKLEIKGDPIGCVWIQSVGEFKTSFLKSLCTQISIAMNNIMSNESLEYSGTEKSVLLSFSNEIAAVRDKDGLSQAINKTLKGLGLIKKYVIRVINDDNETARLFLWDSRDEFTFREDFHALIAHHQPIGYGLIREVLDADGPVLFDLTAFDDKPDRLAYVAFWRNIGMDQVLGIALRSGEKNIGVIWMDPDMVDIGLLKSLCSQISIAISNILAIEKVNSQLEEINRYKQQLEYENLYLQEQIQIKHNYAEIIGSGAAMQQVFSLMSQVSYSGSTVLILGETGTGKELIARGIHNNSPRKDKLMVKVNCAALPANLIESELFGHEKGSFTGATDRRIGKFELAHNGTLFLDEIGEMPLELQVKLLRALQEKEIERVGGRTPIKVDVRVIAATNRNLEQEVKNGRFRSDLYYRLNVFPMQMPPLRDRPEDIPILTQFFVDRFAKNSGKQIIGVSHKAMQDMQRYHWPGNVRELEHLMERSVLLASGTTIKEVFLPQLERGEAGNSGTDAVESIRTLDENERDHIITVLKKTRGKVFGFRGAAEILGVPPSTLNSRIIKLGIKKEQLFVTGEAGIQAG